MGNPKKAEQIKKPAETITLRNNTLANSIIEKNFIYRLSIITGELKKQGLVLPKKEILKRVLKIEEEKKKARELEEKLQVKTEIILPCQRKVSELFGKKCWHGRCYLKEKCLIFERR
jgi:hypothetical protein